MIKSPSKKVRIDENGYYGPGIIVECKENKTCAIKVGEKIILLHENHFKTC